MAKVKLSNGKEIEVREPKVRDMRIVANEPNEQEQEVKLIANLTGLTLDEVDELSLKDYALISEVVKDFLP
jgi:hypothetical protein